MKLSQHFGMSLRPEAASTGVEGHDFLIRAGYVHHSATGVWDVLPLGMKVLQNIQSLWRKGMQTIGASEYSLANPSSSLTPSLGYYDGTGDQSHKIQMKGRSFVFAPHLLHSLLSLFQQHIHSYRQLPLVVWEQRQAPLLSQSFGPALFSPLSPQLLEAWVIAPSEEILQAQMQRLASLTNSTLKKMELPNLTVGTDPGIFGSRSASSWVFPTSHGKLQFQQAGEKRTAKQLVKLPFSVVESDPLPIEKVRTPGTKSIQDLATFLNIPESQTAKVVFYQASTIEHSAPQLAIVVIRGDHEVNELAVRRTIGASSMRAASEEEIQAVGAVPGFASPIGIRREGVLVLADEAVAQQSNLVAGANEMDYHLLNTCFGRDYEADKIGNFRLAQEGVEGDQGPIHFETGVELSKLIHIGSAWPSHSEITFMGAQGKPEPIHLGYCRWNLSQLLSACAAHHYDEKGLVWPGQLSPYQVQLVSLADGEETIQTAERLYQQLQTAGISVLYDDRHKKAAGPGVKFTDADLRGIPIRITIAKRALKQGGVEWKLRDQEEKEIILVEEVGDKCRSAF